MSFEEVMKFFILSVPSLLVLACAAALHAQMPARVPPLTPQQRDAEIRELRQELDSINSRLQALEVEGRNTLQRGIGNEA
jgi:hypothetical protein